MRYSDPPMMYRHPTLTMGHMIDGFNKKAVRVKKHPSKREREMNLSKKFLSCFLTIIFFGLTTTASLAAESVTGCHCFKDRTYNPLDKFAADGYILATSFNSLLSEYFGISKRQIIQHRMQGGIDQDDLLIGLTISKDSGVTLNTCLTCEREKNPGSKF